MRFHGVRKELIRAQADALGKTLLQFETHPDDFEHVKNLIGKTATCDVAVGIADSHGISGECLHHDNRCVIPFERAVGLGLVGGHGVGTCRDALDGHHVGRVKMAHRKLLGIEPDPHAVIALTQK